MFIGHGKINKVHLLMEVKRNQDFNTNQFENCLKV